MATSSLPPESWRTSCLFVDFDTFGVYHDKFGVYVLHFCKKAVPEKLDESRVEKRFDEDHRDYVCAAQNDIVIKIDIV